MDQSQYTKVIAVFVRVPSRREERHLVTGTKIACQGRHFVSDPPIS